MAEAPPVHRQRGGPAASPNPASGTPMPAAPPARCADSSARPMFIGPAKAGTWYGSLHLGLTCVEAERGGRLDRSRRLPIRCSGTLNRPLPE
jgi:hypothetical protein